MSKHVFVMYYKCINHFTISYSVSLGVAVVEEY